MEADALAGARLALCFGDWKEGRVSPVLPDHVLRLMSPADRAKLGPAGTLASEAQERWQKREERKMHDELGAFLRLKQIPHIHARMDQKSTIRAGWPDFTCMLRDRFCIPQHHARVVCVELKAVGGVLSQAQREVIAELERAGVPVLVATSSGEAIQFIISELLT